MKVFNNYDIGRFTFFQSFQDIGIKLRVLIGKPEDPYHQPIFFLQLLFWGVVIWTKQKAKVTSYSARINDMLTGYSTEDKKEVIKIYNDEILSAYPGDQQLAHFNLAIKLFKERHP